MPHSCCWILQAPHIKKQAGCTVRERDSFSAMLAHGAWHHVIPLLTRRPAVMLQRRSWYDCRLCGHLPPSARYRRRSIHVCVTDSHVLRTSTRKPNAFRSWSLPPLCVQHKPQAFLAACYFTWAGTCTSWETRYPNFGHTGHTARFTTRWILGADWHHP